MQYELHIYPPNGIGGDVCGVLQSTQPFMSIQRGDILNPRTWNEHWSQIYTQTPECPHGFLLRVIGLEHQIVQMKDETITRHVIMVYTQAVDDVEESRP